MVHNAISLLKSVVAAEALKRKVLSNAKMSVRKISNEQVVLWEWRPGCSD